MPTSALRNLSRSTPRASRSRLCGSDIGRSAGRCVCALRKSSRTWSMLRCTAGAMMWLGCSPRSWMMYSPRSVSTGVTPLLLEEIVEADLLGDHRLALGDGLRVHPAADVEHEPARLHGICRPMHMAASLRHLLLIGFEVEIEIVEHMVLDCPCAVAQVVELRQVRRRLGALVDEVDLHMAHGLLQLRIVKRAGGVFLEGGGGDLDHLFAFPDCRNVDHPRQHFRHVAHLDARCPRASACRPCSSGSQDRPPAASRRRVSLIVAVLSMTMELEMSGYLTQNVPPKPQQTSAPFISASSSPATVPSSLRGCCWIFELAQARAGIVIGRRPRQAAHRRKPCRAHR